MRGIPGKVMDPIGCYPFLQRWDFNYSEIQNWSSTLVIGRFTVILH
jgi:hypothetical protein